MKRGIPLKTKSSLSIHSAFRFLVLSSFLILFQTSAQTTKFTGGFFQERANFSLAFKSEVSPFRVTSIFVLPGEKQEFSIHRPKKNGQYVMEFNSGEIIESHKTSWVWKAPNKTGLHRIKIREFPSKSTMFVHVFVMVPFDKVKKGWLNGYRIGRYPEKPLKGQAIYERPRGFIEVTEENKNEFVMPHFQLGQFLCKQKGSYPKYIVLRERLILKLEHLWEEVNEKGHSCDTLHVMSGYRTPYYNRAIGNVKYSRHVWGDAADIFIDYNPRDWYLDDLNQNGRKDRNDVVLLRQIVEDFERKPAFMKFIGGLGLYRPNRAHGPFVHVDARGKKSRWGNY